MQTRIEPVQFADGRYTLALNLKQIIELELTEEERSQLDRSVESVKNVMKVLS